MGEVLRVVDVALEPLVVNDLLRRWTLRRRCMMQLCVDVMELHFYLSSASPFCVRFFLLLPPLVDVGFTSTHYNDVM